MTPRGRGAGALGVVLVLGLVLGLARRPVAPKPADAAAGDFSEARAMPVVEALAGGLGPRPVGSPEAARAVELLERRLRALPGVEVVRQEVTGTWTVGGVVVYRVVNVLARLAGERPDAVLLSAHYDSPAESPGAADDGLGVAAGVEVMRALAAGPRPRNTVVLNLNGGEEPGLLGAEGFLQHHPWARDVKVFINLEAVGSGGRAVLFRAGRDQRWLIDAYASSVPHPTGSVLGQDLMGSGVVPLFTDFEKYASGLRQGVDMATLEDGYAYHTELDRPGRLAPGTLQHLGDNTLALSRALASHPLEPERSEPVGAFFDVLGVGMIVYSRGTAELWALLAVLLTAGAWGAAIHRGGVTLRGLMRGCAWTISCSAAASPGGWSPPGSIARYAARKGPAITPRPGSCSAEIATPVTRFRRPAMMA